MSTYRIQMLHFGYCMREYGPEWATKWPPAQFSHCTQTGWLSAFGRTNGSFQHIIRPFYLARIPLHLIGLLVSLLVVRIFIIVTDIIIHLVIFIVISNRIHRLFRKLVHLLTVIEKNRIQNSSLFEFLRNQNHKS